MYSFAQRPDTQAVDEPLYAHYLRVSGAIHPGRDTVLEAMDNDGRRVVEEVILGPCRRPVLFCKQMAHHLRDLDWAFLDSTVNVILIRDPVEVLPTLSVQIPNPGLADTGYEVQARLLERFSADGPVPVLDARELLLNPRRVLGTLCDTIGLDFDENMLSWPAGAREFDGVWAEWWYHNVHRSTGFIAYRPKTDPFPDTLQPLLAQCRPFYEKLYSAAIKA